MHQHLLRYHFVSFRCLLLLSFAGGGEVFVCFWREEGGYIVPKVPRMLADRGMEVCGAIAAGGGGVGPWSWKGRVWDVVCGVAGL